MSKVTLELDAVTVARIAEAFRYAQFDRQNMRYLADSTFNALHLLLDEVDRKDSEADQAGGKSQNSVAAMLHHSAERLNDTLSLMDDNLVISRCRYLYPGDNEETSGTLDTVRVGLMQGRDGDIVIPLGGNQDGRDAKIILRSLYTRG